MIEFKLTGNWSVVGLALNKLPTELRSSATWGQRKGAEQLVKIAKNHINRQDLKWRPRSKATLSNDPRILVDSEAYYANIKAWKQGNTYYAGVQKGVTNAKGTPIHVYAIAHEYGLGRVPRRPLWGPTLKEAGGKSGLAKIVKQAIYNKIKKLEASGFEVNQ